MKSIIITLAIIGCAYAAVDESHAEIVKQEFEMAAEGSYNYLVDTGNGIHSEAHAVLKPSANKDEPPYLTVEGSSSYQSPEGESIQLKYTADENGYQPQGAHLPTPVPVPDYIARAVQYIEQHPYVEAKKL